MTDRTFRFFIVAALLLLLCGRVRADEVGSADVLLNTVIETYSESLAADKNLSGRGTAYFERKLVVNVSGQNEEPTCVKSLYVDFTLKRDRSRSDCFDLQRDKDGHPIRGNPFRTYLRSPNASIVFENGHIAIVNIDTEVHQYDPGWDFSSGTFSRMQPLGDFLSLMKFMKKQGNFRIEKTQAGEILMESTLSSGTEAYRWVLKVDPKYGCRPLMIREELTGYHGEGGRRITQMDIEWQAKDGWIFPVRAVRDAKSSIPNPIQSPGAPKDATLSDRIEIVIENYKQDIGVKDEEFTMEGLAIAPDNLVEDRVKGVKYLYGQPETVLTEP